MFGDIVKNNQHMEILMAIPLIVFLYSCNKLFMTFLIIGQGFLKKISFPFVHVFCKEIFYRIG